VSSGDSSLEPSPPGRAGHPQQPAWLLDDPARNRAPGCEAGNLRTLAV